MYEQDLQDRYKGITSRAHKTGFIYRGMAVDDQRQCVCSPRKKEKFFQQTGSTSCNICGGTIGEEEIDLSPSGESRFNLKKKVTALNPNKRYMRRTRSGLANMGALGRKETSSKADNSDKKTGLALSTCKKIEGETDQVESSPKSQDCLASVPIKKRRINVGCSSTSSSSKEIERRDRSDIQENGKGFSASRGKHDIGTVDSLRTGQLKNSGGIFNIDVPCRKKRTKTFFLPKKFFNDPDFSGIEFLATVACLYEGNPDDAAKLIREGNPLLDVVKLKSSCFQSDSELGGAWQNEQKRENEDTADIRQVEGEPCKRQEDFSMTTAAEAGCSNGTSTNILHDELHKDSWSKEECTATENMTISGYWLLSANDPHSCFDSAIKEGSFKQTSMIASKQEPLGKAKHSKAIEDHLEVLNANCKFDTVNVGDCGENFEEVKVSHHHELTEPCTKGKIDQSFRSLDVPGEEDAADLITTEVHSETDVQAIDIQENISGDISGDIIDDTEIDKVSDIQESRQDVKEEMQVSASSLKSDPTPDDIVTGDVRSSLGNEALEPSLRNESLFSSSYESEFKSRIPLESDIEHTDAALAVTVDSGYVKEASNLNINCDTNLLECPPVERSLNAGCCHNFDGKGERELRNPLSFPENALQEEANGHSLYEDGEFTCKREEQRAITLETGHVDCHHSDGKETLDPVKRDEQDFLSLQSESKFTGELTTIENAGHVINCHNDESSQPGYWTNGQFGDFAKRLENSTELEGHTASTKNTQNSSNSNDTAKSRELRDSSLARSKVCGWDHLPKDFGEDGALNTAKNANAGYDAGGALPSQREPQQSVPSRRIRSIIDVSSSEGNGNYDRIRSDSCDESFSFSRTSCRGRAYSRFGYGHHPLNSKGSGLIDHQSKGWLSSNRSHYQSYDGSFRASRHLRSTSAAAISAAKLENSGFVVASDGTIVKAHHPSPLQREEGYGWKNDSHSFHEVSGTGKNVFDNPMNRIFEKQRNASPHREANVSPYKETFISKSQRRFHSDIVSSSRDGGSERYRRELFEDSDLDHLVSESRNRAIESVGYCLDRIERSVSPSSHRRPSSSRNSFYYRSNTRTREYTRLKSRSPRYWHPLRVRAIDEFQRESERRGYSSSSNIMSEGRRHKYGYSFPERESLRHHLHSHVSSVHSKWSNKRRDREDFRNHDFSRSFSPLRNSRDRYDSSSRRDSFVKSSLVRSSSRQRSMSPICRKLSEFRSEPKRRGEDNYDWKCRISEESAHPSRACHIRSNEKHYKPHTEEILK